MTTLPITTNTSGSVLDTSRSGSLSPTNGLPQRRSTVANPPPNDTVTVSKNATPHRNASISFQDFVPSDFFASYLDTLMQQRIGGAMIQKALTPASKTSGSQMSVLGNYQTLQYQKSMYESVYNLKSNSIQSIFNTTA